MLDRNLAPPTYNAAGMPIFPSARPDPSLGILQINESTAHSRYRALLTGLRRRMSDRFTVEASYTFAVNRDDDSNERDLSRNLVLDPYNLENQWGYSKQDIRHNAVISGVVRLPFGFTYGSILQARSGLPYTAVIGSDVQGDGNTANDRAIIDGRVVARNSFRQPSFFSWDMRLLKDLPLGGHARVTLSIEAFNVTAASNKNFGPDQESIYGDLQRAHQAFPWLVVWDDHELFNDYSGEVVSRDPRLRARQQAAYQAFAEHMPIRARLAPGHSTLQMYRALRLGQLADPVGESTRPVSQLAPRLCSLHGHAARVAHGLSRAALCLASRRADRHRRHFHPRARPAADHARLTT